jgi:hypothetical protein
LIVVEYQAGTTINSLGDVIIGWLWKTQGSVPLSSTEAEYVSASSTGVQNIVFLIMLLEECGFEVILPGIHTSGRQ